MGLLRADVTAAVNGLLRDGRGSLLPRVLPPLLLGAMYWLLGRVLLEQPELLRLLRRGGDSMQVLFGAALAPCPIVAGWVGLAHAQRQLFEAPELTLWFGAPIWSGRGAAQVLARAAATAMLWAFALCLPFALQLVVAADAGIAGGLLAAAAIATAVLPLLCVAVGVQLVLLRFASGRWARILLSASGSLAAFGFPVFLLLQVFTGAPQRAAALDAAARGDDAASPLVAPGAQALTALVRGEPLAPHVLPLVWPLVAAAALFALAAPLHGVAVQNHRLAEPRRRSRARTFAERAVAALRQKEFAQLRHQRGAMLHMLLVAAMVFVLAQQRVIGRSIDEIRVLAPEVRQVAQLLVYWFLAVLMLLYAHMGRLAAWDGPQWPLFTRAPIAARTLLLGKLQAIALLMLWPMLVAALVGVQFLDAGPRTLLAFVALAGAGSLIALGVVAAIGTMPVLLRRELDGTLQHAPRGLAGSILLVAAFEAAVAPMFVWWHFALGAVQRSELPGSLAALFPEALLLAAALGAGVFGVGCLVALGNYRRLLRPR